MLYGKTDEEDFLPKYFRKLLTPKKPRSMIPPSTDLNHCRTGSPAATWTPWSSSGRWPRTRKNPHMTDPPAYPMGRRRGRLRLLVGGACAVLAVVATAVLPGTARAATQICSNQTGTNGGMYYQMWSNGQGSACITLNSSNSYSSTWSGIGDFVGGVGWNPGSTQSVTYSGSLSGSG